MDILAFEGVPGHYLRMRNSLGENFAIYLLTNATD